MIVHGACPTGVDAAFDAACGESCVSVERHPAEWDVGLTGGPLRNTKMVNLGATFAIALHKQIAWSKGTADCARKCLRAGIAVWLVDNDDGVVRRLTEGDLERRK